MLLVQVSLDSTAILGFANWHSHVSLDSDQVGFGLAYLFQVLIYILDEATEFGFGS